MPIVSHKSPPAELDGAHVKRFASLEGVAHQSKVSSSIDGVPTPQPAGIVIAVYQGESEAYVFHCASDWSVLAAGHHPSLEAAIRAAERGFPGVAERWVVAGHNHEFTQADVNIWWAHWSRPIVISMLIFLGVLLGSVGIVYYREGQCAEQCRNSGAMGYEYKGFSSSGSKSLREDHCKCSAS